MSGNWLDLSNISNKFVRTYVKGFVDMSGGNLLLRNNQIFVNKGDVCVGGLISQPGNVNLTTTTTRDAPNVIICTNDVISGLNANSSIAVISATSSTFSGSNSFTGGLVVSGNTFTDNSTLYVANDASLNGRLFVGGTDSSFANGTVFVGGQTTIGGKAIMLSDSSINGRLVVQGDVSLNSNLMIGGNLNLTGTTHTISGNLSTTNSICGTSTINGSETIGGNETVAGRIDVAGNITINGNLDLTGAVIIGPKGITSTTTTVIDLSTGYYNNNWAAAAGLPTNGLYRDISISSTGQYILVAETGNAYVSSNYGSTWITNPTGLVGGAVSLAGYQRACVSSTGQYMLTSSDLYGIYLSTNYGQTWIVPSGLTVAASISWSGAAISSTGQYMLLCYYPNGSVYLSTNYGLTFTANPVGLTTATLWQTTCISSTGQYMLAGNYGATGSLYISSDYGITFTTSSTLPSGLSTGDFVSSSISSTGQYMLACTNDAAGKVYRSTNYGLTWAVANGLPINFNYSDVNVSSTGQYMMACYRTGGNVYYSSDYGATWATNTSIPNTGNTVSSLLNYYAVAMSSTGQYMMAAMYTRGIYFSKPPTVTRSTTIINGLITGNDLSMNGNLYTNMMSTSVVPMTRTYTAANVGRKWQIVSGGLPTSAAYRNVSMNATGQYMLAPVLNNTTGLVYLSTNYGQTFASVGLAVASYMGSCISATGQYMVVVVYTSSINSVYLSSNYGVTWTQPSTVNVSNSFYTSVTISSTGQYMLIGNLGLSTGVPVRLFRSADYGQTWAAVSNLATDSYISTSISDTGQYMATVINNSVTNKQIQVSSDYGVTWNSRGTAALNYRDISISATGQYMLACRDPTTGAVYLSSDYGQTFNTVSGFNGGYGVYVSSTGQYMLIGSVSGALSLSSNYGSTWTSTTLGSTAMWHPAISANGQYMLANADTGSVYLSKTTDLSYSTVSTNVPYMNIKGYVGFSDMSSSYVNPSASTKALVEINGTSGTTGSNIDAYSLFTSGSILSGQNLVVASDRRIKTNIVDVVDVSAMSVIQQLKPKRYNYIDVKNRGEAPVWGFIAQEVGEVLDYAVNKTSAYIPNVYKSAVVDGYRVTCVGVKQKMEGVINSSVDLSANLSVDVVTDSSDNVVTDSSANVVTDSSDNVVTDSSDNVVTDLSANVVTDSSDNVVTDSSDNVVTDSTPKEGFERETMGFPSTGVSLLDKTGQTIYATIDRWIDDDSFMVKEWLSDGPEDWFLYGQLVHDFNALDKMAIYTIATAALQEFDTEFQETRRQVAQLKARLRALKPTLAGSVNTDLANPSFQDISGGLSGNDLPIDLSGNDLSGNDLPIDLSGNDLSGNDLPIDLSSNDLPIDLSGNDLSGNDLPIDLSGNDLSGNDLPIDLSGNDLSGNDLPIDLSGNDLPIDLSVNDLLGDLSGNDLSGNDLPIDLSGNDLSGNDLPIDLSSNDLPIDLSVNDLSGNDLPIDLSGNDLSGNDLPM